MTDPKPSAFNNESTLPFNIIFYMQESNDAHTNETASAGIFAILCIGPTLAELPSEKGSQKFYLLQYSLAQIYNDIHMPMENYRISYRAVAANFLSIIPGKSY